MKGKLLNSPPTVAAAAPKPTVSLLRWRERKVIWIMFGRFPECDKLANKTTARADKRNRNFLPNMEPPTRMQWSWSLPGGSRHANISWSLLHFADRDSDSHTYKGFQRKYTYHILILKLTEAVCIIREDIISFVLCSNKETFNPESFMLIFCKIPAIIFHVFDLYHSTNNH